MKKRPVVTVAEPEEAARLSGLPSEVTTVLADTADFARDGLLRMCTEVGQAVMVQMMDAELTCRVGPKHAKIPDREANWHGTTRAQVRLGGRKVTVERPRARTTGGAEVELETWATFSSTDLLNVAAAERMLAGLVARRQGEAGSSLGRDLAPRSAGMARSSISRRWRRATEKALGELMARDLSTLKVVALMIAGVELAGQFAVVALATCAGGERVPVGVRQAGAGDSSAVTALLADLVRRGLSAEGGLLVVTDGAKALGGAIAKIFGERVVVQRCSLRRRRSSKDDPPGGVAH